MTETNGRATLAEVRDLVADAKEASQDQHKETLREIGKLSTGQLRHARQIANLQMRVAMVTKTCKERPAICAMQHRESRRESDDLRDGIDERRRQVDATNMLEFNTREDDRKIAERLQETSWRVKVMWGVGLFALTLLAGGIIDVFASLITHHWLGL